MNAHRRPVSILVAAGLYLAVGVLGFAAHFGELRVGRSDAPMIELTEFLAVVAGVFLLRRQNWARWLALAWIAFHVLLSALHSTREMAIHGLLCLAIAWLLFNTAADGYFRSAETEAT